jgi:hypothetical protein
MERLTPTWRKSSYSGNGGANCVEAGAIPGAILIRDTKDKGRGPVLRFTPAAFAEFTSRLHQDAAL